MSLMHRLFAAVRRLRKDGSGATAVVVALLMPALFGMTALVVDIGRLYVFKLALQNATDAAALAGAQDIYLGTTQAIASATAYSATAGNKNVVRGLTVTMVSPPTVECSSTWQTSAACLGPNTSNVITVRQRATVNLLFGRLIGFNSMTITAVAKAAAKGGLSKPVKVAVVLDISNSMNAADTTCGISGATRLDCAKAGVRALLLQLDPATDSVALLAFPGTTNATQAALAYDCNNSTKPATQKYSLNPVYTFVAPTQGYRATYNGPLTASNSLVTAVGGNTGCTSAGLPVAPSSVCDGTLLFGIICLGTSWTPYTYYADAIAAAETLLASTAPANGQKAIIFLSDGDSNAPADILPAGTETNQCQRAVANARTSTAAGTWVFSIAYGASNSSGCSRDTSAYVPALTPPINSPRVPCKIMQNIASDLPRFFSNNNCPNSTSNSNLINVFTGIGQGLHNARLIPNTG